jgi:hypothetical protein
MESSANQPIQRLAHRNGGRTRSITDGLKPANRCVPLSPPDAPRIAPTDPPSNNSRLSRSHRIRTGGTARHTAPCFWFLASVPGPCFPGAPRVAGEWVASSNVISRIGLQRSQPARSGSCQANPLDFPAGGKTDGFPAGGKTKGSVFCHQQGDSVGQRKDVPAPVRRRRLTGRRAPV